MRYCPDCGTPHECEAQGASEKAEVAIERLRTTRDIEVARINATAATNIAETEAETSADFAEGKAEGMEETIDAMTGNDAEPELPEGAPIVVETTPDPEPEPEPDMVPPLAEPSAPTEPKRSGWWDGYR